MAQKGKVRGEEQASKSSIHFAGGIRSQLQPMGSQSFVEIAGGNSRLNGAGEVVRLDIEDGVEFGKRNPTRGGSIRVVARDAGAISRGLD